MQRLYWLIGTIALVFLAAGLAGAWPLTGQAAHSAAPAASLPTTDAPLAGELANDLAGWGIVPIVVDTVGSRISYQGLLTAPDGTPLDGEYTMRFTLYDDPVGGDELWDSEPLDVTASNGLVHVVLDVEHNIFDGQALWLRIRVDGETLSPRQEILPAPYALSLRPGAAMRSEDLSENEAALSIFTPATGSAYFASAVGGNAFAGSSRNNFAVIGTSTHSTGGFFASGGGNALRVLTNSDQHYDPGAWITSNQGYAVLAQSQNNQAVRGEAGDVADIPHPLGAVGVVGIGSNRGAYGASLSGVGLYGTSQSNYGLWAQSEEYRGLIGGTLRDDHNYGLFTPDNLFSLNVNLAGSIAQVMQNGGREPLQPGDVVVFSGVNTNVSGIDSPIVQVRRADSAASTAVAGVVHSTYNIDTVVLDAQPWDERQATRHAELADMEVTSDDPAPPGDFVLVVVQGLAQVNVSVSDDTVIAPGDLLASGASDGYAGIAPTVQLAGVETAIPGTVFGKALEPLDRAEGKIHVYVTLQ